ncbi:ABC transporter ATP-binding protein [Pseudomonas hefeiensis]|uniref:Spermidine/putrescine import ATP-binding protein PotA n=1 Tax=Pseudomonas hefeiensis TaxID=2738125 RepID=A0ABY9GGP6_9PSED|nr:MULTISPECIES: ABC transporter ATP-binding protein [unclassified Pseudomonas]WLH14839.1 ABC transporter ATP-binding protein [Pseudomonas sp. FP205]WLH97892.1 ABC transporter ATP-binding protein [Pseudomonas sp. FP53]WLI42165.1 ABC transporter ATP-binding protein [Pseudomonas sp. FP821]
MVNFGGFEMIAEGSSPSVNHQIFGAEVTVRDTYVDGERLQVCFKNVCKSYDGASWVVKDLNLDIQKGEFVSFLGPSGSGKTTTLMMLAGFEHPSEGHIIVDGLPIQDLPPEKRDMGVVFQNYALFPHLTVEENIGYPLKMRKIVKPEIERRVEEVMKLVQLDKMSKRKPSELSGGQQQRVALARALVFEPKLVLMDEPLGALDKRLREDLQLEIKHICNRLKLTVVYVTHDQGEALTMSDRVAVFNNGVIQQLATPQDIYQHPVNTFVATFVGENNKIHGVVESIVDGKARVKLKSSQIISARASNHTCVGEQCTIVVRPEKVRLTPVGGDCAISGVVLESVFYGDEFRVHVDVGGGQEVVARMSGEARSSAYKAGNKVIVEWNAEDSEALDYLP